MLYLRGEQLGPSTLIYYLNFGRDLSSANFFKAIKLCFRYREKLLLLSFKMFALPVS